MAASGVILPGGGADAAEHSEEVAGGGPRLDFMAPELRKSRVVLGVLFVVYLFSSVDRSVMGIMIQPIKEELLLADWQVGFMSGFSFSLLFLVCGLGMARLADKGNRVTILTICIAIWSVMTALSGLAINFTQLCLARMGVGVGEAGCLPTSHSLISDYFPHSTRTKALALYGLGFPLGGVIGSMLAGVLLDHWGWRVAFYAVGAPGLLLALLNQLMVKEPQRGRYDVGTANDPAYSAPMSLMDVLRTMWGSPVLRQMVIGLTLMSAFASPTVTFLTPYLVRRFPTLSYTEVGTIIGTSMMLGASISTVAGSWLAQWLAMRRGESWLLWLPGISISSGAVPYVIALLQHTPVGFALWLLLAAIINAAYLAPSYTVLYKLIPPGGRAKAAVVLGVFIGLVGQSFGPLFAGFANDWTAAWLFAQHGGHDFLASCPGGHAVKGASAALEALCRQSVADSTQRVLIATMALTLWPGLHFYFAGRNMQRAKLA